MLIVPTQVDLFDWRSGRDGGSTSARITQAGATEEEDTAPGPKVATEREDAEAVDTKDDISTTKTNPALPEGAIRKVYLNNTEKNAGTVEIYR